MTSNPEVSTECRQHHLLSHDSDSMKQEQCSWESAGRRTAASLWKVPAGGMMLCFQHCGFVRDWTQKQPMSFVSSRHRSAEGWTRALWDVCPVPFRRDYLNGSRSHCELLCVSHWPSAAPRSEISHPRPMQFTHPKRSARLQCQTLLEFNRLSQELLCDKFVCVLYRCFPSALDIEHHRPFRNWNCGICLSLLILSFTVIWL